MKHVAIVVDWFGPYGSVTEAAKVARSDYSAGLYVVVGKRKHQKSAACLQYVGIAKDLAARMYTSAGIKDVTRDRRIWLGEVGSLGIPGKKTKVTDEQIALSEWAHAYFLQLPLNTKKRGRPPSRPVTIINRWWRVDYETPARQRPHKDWPDVIDYLGKAYGAKVAWFGNQRFKKWNPDDLA